MKIIGHRGARGLAPENTVASLLKALEHNVDEIEFDLHVTKDGVVILNHNHEFHDASGNDVVIVTHSYKELLEHKADLTTFMEAAKAINRKVPMLIEIKRDVDTRPIVKEIKALLEQGWEPSDMLLGSFSHKILVDLHKALPEIQIVVIERWSGVRAVIRAKHMETKRLNMNHRWLWWGFVQSMSRRGWELYPYTLNDVAKAKRWEKHGLAGIITDFPDQFEK